MEPESVTGNHPLERLMDVVYVLAFLVGFLAGTLRYRRARR